MKRVLLLGMSLLFINYVQSQGWGEIQKFVPDDRALGDEFGYAVAMQGEYTITGALFKATTSSQNGAVYIFKQNGSGLWQQEQKITQSSINQFDFFGNSVSLDGDYLIVGCRGQDYDENENNFQNSAGAAYIFEKNVAGNWIQAQKLVGADRTSLDVFGDSVAISGDYAVVSAPWEDEDENDTNTQNLAGSAFVFERDAGGMWQRVQKIVASDRKANVQFGDKSVAIDGNYIAIGVFRESEDATGQDEIPSAGAVYIYERNGAGVWNEVQKVVAAGREQGEWFGKSVAIEGDIMIVGAANEYLQGDVNTQYGAIYVFERDTNGIWNEVDKIRPDFLNHTSKFGHSVDLDGNRIVVGAYFMDVGSAGDGGVAFIFEKDGTGIWNQVATMYDPDANNSDYFGYDVAISGDFAMVGAYQEDEDQDGLNYLQSAGSAFIFDVNEPNTLPPLNTLSLTENEFEKQIIAFPNPVNAVMRITLGDLHEKVDVSIVNILGQEVLNKSFSSISQIHVNIENLKSGIYIVNLKSEKASIQKLKIIKK